jgi:hypothetical protein
MQKIIRPGNTEIVILYLRYLLSIGHHVDAVVVKGWSDWLYRTSGYFDSDRVEYSFGPTLSLFLNQYAESLRGCTLILMPISLKALKQISEIHIASFLDSLGVLDVLHSGTFDYEIINNDTRASPVLIISPYSTLMIRQFESGSMRHIRPDFSPSDILGYRFPYLFGGDSKYASSLAAIDAIKEELSTFLESVDSVVLSCGCYGAPLSKYCHDRGKNVYYVGGDLQIFFGIMGGRWRPWLENDEHYLATKQFWINEIPSEFIYKEHSKIEKSSYW